MDILWLEGKSGQPPNTSCEYVEEFVTSHLYSGKIDPLENPVTVQG